MSRPTPHAPTTPTSATRRPAGRLVAGGLAVAVALAAGVALTEVRANSTAAAAEARQAGEVDLVGALTDARLAFDDHARTADTAAATALRHHVRVIGGGDHDPQLVAEQVTTLRDQADALSRLADDDRPSRPGPVAVEDADPLLDRLVQLQDQADELADGLRTAADDTETLDATLRDLGEASARYAEDATLTASDAPAEVAGAWRDDLDRLADFRDRLDAIDPDASRVDVTPLVAVQRSFVDQLETVAETAVARLENGDLDGYAQLLESRLDSDDLLGTADDLETAREEVTAELLDGRLPHVRGRALGLLVELGVLRDEAAALLRD